MNKQIKTINHGITHQIATCEVCDWASEDHSHEGRTHARMHVRDTGHTVKLETGMLVKYELMVGQ
ncbi:MAG: hypothetical protein GY938_16835 [Ketobacter sp.]|nr:hypothetical protein [Ketobacter sp.]